jgi:phage tail-like protein
MDANGLRFWMLGEARHFAALRHTVWDAGCRVLRLASERGLQPMLDPAAAQAVALAALDTVPRAVDALGSVATWDAGAGAVVVHSEQFADMLLLPLPQAPTDLCAGADGILYAALPDGVRLHDLRGRWADAAVALAGFVPWRLAPAAGGGVWVLERGSGRVARLHGRPRRAQSPEPDDYSPDVFRPSPENGDAPVFTLLPTPELQVGEQVLALAAGADSADGGADVAGAAGTHGAGRANGGLAVLSWLDADGNTALRRWDAAARFWSAPARLQGAAYAYALAWLAPDRIALRVPGRRDAPAFDLQAADATNTVPPLGEVYPLADLPGAEGYSAPQEAPFANGAVTPPHYPAGLRGARPLHALSTRSLARRGEADNHSGSGDDFRAWLVDSGDMTTVWHRLNAEADIPAHCGFVVSLAATNEARPPKTSDGAAWHAHGFGRDIATLDDAMRAPQVPRAVWDRAPSELPGHPGLLGGEPVPGTRGLFSVLVQNSRRRVRTLVGRYLWVRVVLHGDGRATPQVAALRAWGSRFSYADRYLPRLYRENLFGDAAKEPGEHVTQIEAIHVPLLDAGGPLNATLRARLMLEGLRFGPEAKVTVERRHVLWLLQDGASAWRLAALPGGGVGVYRPQASPADFNARLLANFEGVLTQLEDRVAAAHLLTHPAAVPEAELDWLAGWIGVAFDAALPAARRRAWLAAAPDLARRHGTRDGLRLALDVATGGGVRGGEIIVIENFRLRRILATLLGVDLVDENDPLLPGLQLSGNSVVGDTLVLGDHERAELLALFRDDPTTLTDDAVVLRFDEQLAHRALVLVHREVEAQDFALIRRIVKLEAPAHVEVQVAAATWPLLVGVASLVGVDTYLGPPRTPRPVQVQRSVLGLGDRLIGPVVLDPRLSGVPATAGAGSLVLDGDVAPAAPPAAPSARANNSDPNPGRGWPAG